MTWMLVLCVFTQMGGLPAKHPYRIDYQYRQMDEEGETSFTGTLWVMGNLWKVVQKYPNGRTQVDLYDGQQWWLYVSDAPEPTPLKQSPPTSVLEFFTGRPVQWMSETQTELSLPHPRGTIVVKGIRAVPGLGPVPRTVSLVDSKGKILWTITLQAVREAPEIEMSFFQKSTLSQTKSPQLKAQGKKTVWDY